MNFVLSNLGVAFSFFLLLHTLATPVHAQQPPKVFQWKFSNNVNPSDLPTCYTFGITVQPPNSSFTTAGVPPYYMIGYATNGISRTTLLGTNSNSLNWMVDYPVGTKLALSVVDSQGNSGGIPTLLYNVVAGQNENCVVNDDKKDFSVTANVTGTINTCEPWLLTITGGVKPYNVTFLQINSPIVTNVTMGSSDDGYIYIMRGDPGKLMIAAVNDLTGRFAYQAPTVMPQGSSDVNCTGFGSLSGSASKFKKVTAEARAAAESKARSKRAAIIAGTVVPISLLLIVGVGMWYFLCYKPRRNRPREINLFDSSVKPYTETGGPGQVLSINAFLSDPASPGTPPKHPPGLDHPTGGSFVNYSSHGESEHPFDPYNQSDNGSQRPTSGSSRHSAGRPGFTNFPVRRPTVKAVEAGMSTLPGDSHGPRSAPVETSGDSTWGPDPTVTRTTSVGQTNIGESNSTPTVTRTTSVGRTTTGEPELIIQHRDGGPGRVRELPPPYADRGTAES